MASKRRIRRRSCEGKVRHDCAEIAQAAIRALNSLKGYKGPMNAYRCQFCGGYHIGHTPKAIRQKIVAKREKR